MSLVLRSTGPTPAACSARETQMHHDFWDAALGLSLRARGARPATHSPSLRGDRLIRRCQWLPSRECHSSDACTAQNTAFGRGAVLIVTRSTRLGLETHELLLRRVSYPKVAVSACRHPHREAPCARQRELLDDTCAADSADFAGTAFCEPHPTSRARRDTP